MRKDQRNSRGQDIPRSSSLCIITVVSAAAKWYVSRASRKTLPNARLIGTTTAAHGTNSPEI